MLTNRLSLPQSIVNAVRNDPYTRGDSDISVTQLIQPPYQRKLRAENADTVTEDAADRIWSLMGQIGHSIVERAYPEAVTDAMKSVSLAEAYKLFGVVAERRLFMPVNGWTVSGQFDVIEDGCLMDFKFTSVWSVIGETKQEWVNQLNLLRLLALQEDIDVERLQIIAVLRDWSKGKANGYDYPKHQVAVVDIPVWTVEEAYAYLLDRVRVHQAADPPPCSDEERWKRDDVFAVMRTGRKAAVRLFPDSVSAHEHADILGTGHSVQTRPGGYTRCQDYCNVAHLCPQMKSEVIF